jgi:hypothetical protein
LCSPALAPARHESSLLAQRRTDPWHAAGQHNACRISPRLLPTIMLYRRHSVTEPCGRMAAWPDPDTAKEKRRYVERLGRDRWLGVATKILTRRTVRTGEPIERGESGTAHRPAATKGGSSAQAPAVPRKRAPLHRRPLLGGGERLRENPKGQPRAQASRWKAVYRSP